MPENDNPRQDNLRQMWSDEDLDTALATLHSEDRADHEALARGRAALISAAEQTAGSTDGAATTRGTGNDGTPPTAPCVNASRRTARKTPRTWLTAAAAVGVLAIGAAVTYNMVPGGEPLSPGQTQQVTPAAMTLNNAADKVDGIGSHDQQLAEGQYRYIETHAWHLRSVKTPDKPTYSALREQLIETWVPKDRSKEWMQSREVTGNAKWVRGNAEEAKEAGFSLSHPDENGQWRARCGDFFVNEPCTVDGNWQKPTAQWIEELPRDPQQLHQRLVQATKGKGVDEEHQILVYAADALRSGLLPADLRASLYRALAKVPSLEVTDEAANLDGRQGKALGISAEGTRDEIIIDEHTGQFIGERTTQLESSPTAPADTVTSYTSVTKEIVDKIGVSPSN